MTDADEATRQAEEKAREKRDADLVKNRIEELHEQPIKDDFDAEHLKAVHSYIFQDLPDHQPGVVREDEPGWIKTRVLEGTSDSYVVHYASVDVEAKIAKTLDQFGGPEAIKGLTPDVAAGRIAELYGDLDHAHGFYEGNSRTLREFTRELAKEAGFNLDWTGTDVSTEQRNELYMARDLAVMERAFPDLTPAKAMQSNDRLEYEASFVIEALKNDVGERPLEAIIRDGLSPEIQLEQEQARQPVPSQEARAEGIDAAPTAEASHEPRQTEAEADHAAEAASSPLEAEIEAAATAVENVAAHDSGDARHVGDTHQAADRDAPEHSSVEAVASTIEAGIGQAAEFVAEYAGRAIEGLAESFASLLGGGSSPTPTPQQEPRPAPTTAKERHEARLRAFQEREQQQHAANLQGTARSLGVSDGLSPDDLRREQEKRNRDRGGGQSL